jgi:membrane protease YdiL (CAAX protease family)
LNVDELQSLESLPVPQAEAIRSFPTPVQSVLILVGLWLVAFITLVLRSSLAMFLPSGLQFLPAFLMPTVVLLAIVLPIAAARGRFQEPGFSWTWPRITVFLQVIGIALLIFAGSVAFNAVISRFIGRLHASLPNPDCFVAMRMIIIAPVVEETLFRGIILHSFLKSMSPRKAILISSVLFALGHASPYQLMVAFLLGILQGWLYWRFQSIVPAIAIHMSANSLGFGIWIYSFSVAANANEHAQLSQLGLTLAFGISLCALSAAALWLRQLDKTYSIVSAAPA